MRRYISLPLSLLLAAGIHVDWHLARPHHHRWSLAWPYHWVFAGALCFVVGWWIARRWPATRWPVGAGTFLLAVILAQVVEPILEAAFYQHRLGYPIEPERWTVFVQCMAAGIPAYVAALWLSVRRPAVVRVA